MIINNKERCQRIFGVYFIGTFPLVCEYQREKQTSQLVFGTLNSRNED